MVPRRERKRAFWQINKRGDASYWFIEIPSRDVLLQALLSTVRMARTSRLLRSRERSRLSRKKYFVVSCRRLKFSDLRNHFADFLSVAFVIAVVVAQKETDKRPVICIGPSCKISDIYSQAPILTSNQKLNTMSASLTRDGRLMAFRRR